MTGRRGARGYRPSDVLGSDSCELLLSDSLALNSSAENSTGGVSSADSAVGLVLSTFYDRFKLRSHGLLLFCKLNCFFT